MHGRNALWAALACLLALLPVMPRQATAADAPTAVRTQTQIEADWLNQDELARRNPGGVGVTPADDALGAVDGVKDGKWGFHTGADVHPWWQVDLGQTTALDRVLVFNRCDIPDRAARLVLQLSDNAKTWTDAYKHNGATFYGQTDGKPLVLRLQGARARYVRITLADEGAAYLHFDEVEVYGADRPDVNIALWRDSLQCSVSPWSLCHYKPADPNATAPGLGPVFERGRRLAAALTDLGADVRAEKQQLDDVARKVDPARPLAPDARRELYLQARRITRCMALKNPLLNFSDLLFVKRAPGQFSHMSDQNYGWWSRPGGGIFVLKDFRSDSPRLVCLTPGMENGSFLRPDLSWDATKILFAWCRYYPNTAANPNKTDKASLPEDAFYHVFEMNVDGTGLRRITHGRYDDFDPTYLPDGRIAFLSTRRGQATQYTVAAAQLTLTATLPDGYVRCGGDNGRPVPIYTVLVMNPDGSDLRPVSPFENFEWSPSVSNDGRLLFARWDYIDRSNGPYMKLWSVYPDGTDPRIVFGNFTTSPYSAFEARSIPGSEKIVFTASAHHAITGGSLVLLDPNREVDGQAAMTRLTPEVCFPESEGWPISFYGSPYPLSETFYFCGWSNLPLSAQGGLNAANGMGVYLLDAFGNLELLCRDPQLSCLYPIPLRPRPVPPVHSSSVAWDGPQVGRFLLLNIYDGLQGIARGAIKRLRLVGIPPKTQPFMNSPNLGVTGDDPGKFVVGTVPVEADGSAFFQAPSGVCVFFQALDAEGIAVQTMRTATYLQPGQTLSCVGCHENRMTAPTTALPTAVTRAASLLAPGPEGSWPMRYDRLVQPVLDARCASCHSPKGHDAKAAALDLSTPASYDLLLRYGSPSLADHVRARYGEGRSPVGKGAAATSPLLAMLRGGHHDVRLTASDLERVTTWMDVYAQRLGSFSPEQEKSLEQLRAAFVGTLLQPTGEGR